MMRWASGLVAREMRTALSSFAVLGALSLACQTSAADSESSGGAHAETRSFARVRPQVSLVNVEVKGLRPEAEVREKIAAALPKLRGCYERVAKQLPRRPGRVLAQLSVYPNGTPDAPRILGGQFSHHGFERCLMTEMKSLSFGNRPRSGMSEVMIALELTLDVHQIESLD